MASQNIEEEIQPVSEITELSKLTSSINLGVGVGRRPDRKVNTNGRKGGGCTRRPPIEGIEPGESPCSRPLIPGGESIL